MSVEATVTQPERRTSAVTNSMGLIFRWTLPQDAAGHYIPPKRVLPSTEQQAREVAALFGPGGRKEVSKPSQH